MRERSKICQGRSGRDRSPTRSKTRSESIESTESRYTSRAKKEGRRKRGDSISRRKGIESYGSRCESTDDGGDRENSRERSENGSRYGSRDNGNPKNLKRRHSKVQK